MGNREENETAPFTLNIKLKDLERVTRALQDNQVDFDPVENMVCDQKDFHRKEIRAGYAAPRFTSMSAGETTPCINEWLQENQRPERIKVKFREMPPAARRDFLKLINLNAWWEFDWQKEQTTLTYMEEEGWQMFADSHPAEVW